MLKPCLNNASCINLPGSYECKCQQGFKGEFCQDRIDYCANNICISSQTLTCINDYAIEKSECICKQGKFEGIEWSLQIWL